MKTLPMSRAAALTLVSALAFVAFALPVTALSATSQEDALSVDPAITEGQRMVALYYAGELETLWNLMSAEMQGALGSLEQFGTFHEQAEAQLGAESEVISEEISEQGGMTIYLRQAHFTNTGDMILNVVFATDGDGKITGFQVRPAQ